MKHLRDVRTRHLHALRKLRLRHAQLLHPQQDAAKKRGTYPINGGHDFTLKSLRLRNAIDNEL